MKLLYIVNTISGAGGIQRIVLLKAAWLAEHYGYNVHVLVTNADTREIIYEVPATVNLLYIAPEKDRLFTYFNSYKKLLNKSVNSINPDVVVMCDNGLKSFLLPWILQIKVPLVYEMHAAKSLVSKDISRFAWSRLLPVDALANYLFSKFSKFITLTPAGAAEWRLKNSLVMPNPIWLNPKGGNDLTAKKIVVMGRHEPQKGYERMFRIWKKVSAHFPDWTLEIYGNHNPDFDLKKMAAALQLENVVFLDPVRDIELAYSGASLSIMTSETEPFGMVLLEAMACGVPCVAFDCPVGPAAIIDNGVNGFLITDNDEQGFTAHLEQLMENHGLRLKLGAAAKQKAARFNIGVIMQQWDALFTSLIKKQ